MGDEPKDDKSTDEGDGKVTLGAIRSLVKEVINEVTGEADKDTDTRRAGRRVVESRLDRDSKTEDAVEAAIKRLKDQEDRENAEAAREGRLKAVEEKVADKPPVERRKVHKFMGWGE